MQDQKKGIEVVAAPELTAEQERLLREKFAREDQARAEATGEHVYTNPTAERQFIPDLGIKTGDRFHAASIPPRTTVDLAKTYRTREIKASHYLQQMCDPDQSGGAKLLHGRVALPPASRDPLHEMGKLRPDGSFNDPNQDRDYDRALRAFEDKEDLNYGPGRRITTRRPTP